MAYIPPKDRKGGAAKRAMKEATKKNKRTPDRNKSKRDNYPTEPNLTGIMAAMLSGSKPNN